MLKRNKHKVNDVLNKVLNTVNDVLNGNKYSIKYVSKKAFNLNTVSPIFSQILTLCVSTR